MNGGLTAEWRFNKWMEVKQLNGGLTAEWRFNRWMEV